MHPCGVDLRHRSGRQRRAFKLPEDLIRRAAECLGEDIQRFGGGERRHLVLKFRKLVGDLQGQQVPPGGHGLAELHEDRSEFLQGNTDSCSKRLGTGPCRPEFAQPAYGPEQVGRPDNVVQPMAHQRALNDQQSCDLP